MIKRGWDLDPTGADGVFRQETDEVLRKFQAEKGLEVDGKIGSQSWNAAWTLPVTP